MLNKLMYRLWSINNMRSGFVMCGELPLSLWKFVISSEFSNS